nr:hypothetical protein [Tanacetum cinerariifolium]
MDFKRFMMEGVDGEFNFIPEVGSNKDGSSPSSKSVNNEATVVDAEPLTAIHPSEFAKKIGDSDDAPSETDETILISLPDVSLCSGMEVRSIRRIQWIGYGVLEFLGVGTTLDIFQNFIFIPYFQYGVSVFSGYGVLSLFPLWYLVSAEFGALPQNPLERGNKLLILLERVLIKKLRRVKGFLRLSLGCCPRYSSIVETTFEGDQFGETLRLKQDITAVVSMVVLHVATKLISSDEMGLIIFRLVKEAMFHGRCAILEDVANLKEPFDLENMLGYCSSSKEEFD